MTIRGIAVPKALMTYYCRVIWSAESPEKVKNVKFFIMEPDGHPAIPKTEKRKEEAVSALPPYIITAKPMSFKV